MSRPRVVGGAALSASVLLVTTSASATAHNLGGVYEPPLPLVVYVAGAGLAVAVSFAIAFAYAGRWRAHIDENVRHVPLAVIASLKALGIVAWVWIMAQLIVGGSSTAEVSTLFTWVYGWVGLALVCAFIGPVWSWLDPFTTFFDVGAWFVRLTGLPRRRRIAYPERAAAWPAVAGFVFFVWLELAYLHANMGEIVLGYTIVTLAGMAIFGRDRWRAHGEVFSVWFGLLGRLARYAAVGIPGSRAVRRQRFPDGLLGRPWDDSLVVLVAVAAGAILYDGLSQTDVFFRLFGLADVAKSTLLLGLFLTLIAGLALLLTRRVGTVAVGAGLLPISLGYLIAHYLTYLLGEGQRIVIAVSDPLQLGWDLFGTAFRTTTLSLLSPELLWTVMFAAVVGGHAFGAWAGHLGAVETARPEQDVPRVQLPLVVVMVFLTTLTLWSLGQQVFSPSSGTPSVAQVRTDRAAARQPPG